MSDPLYTPTDIDICIGQRIKISRKMSRLKQGELADLLGVSYQQLQKYEKGTNRISAWRLYKCSEVLKVPLYYFFEGLSEVKTQCDNRTGLLDLSLQEMQLLKDFSSISSPKVRSSINELVRGIAGTSNTVIDIEGFQKARSS